MKVKDLFEKYFEPYVDVFFMVYTDSEDDDPQVYRGIINVYGNDGMKLEFTEDEPQHTPEFYLDLEVADYLVVNSVFHITVFESGGEPNEDI